MKKVILTSCCVLAFVMGPASAASPFFECWPSNVIGPPYPTDELIVNSYHEIVPGGPLDLVQDAEHVIKMTMAHEQLIPAELISLELVSHNGGGGQYAVDSFFDVFYTGPAGDFAVDSFFDITYQIRLPGGVGTPTLTQLPSGDFAVDSFFDITYQIDFGDGTSEVINLLGQSLPALKLTNMTIENASLVDSFFDVFVELSVDDGVVPTDIDFSEPILSIRMNGNWTPEPATLALLLLGGLPLLRRNR